jgi:hypothetical protein
MFGDELANLALVFMETPPQDRRQPAEFGIGSNQLMKRRRQHMHAGLDRGQCGGSGLGGGSNFVGLGWCHRPASPCPSLLGRTALLVGLF